jgi:signal transduction histidine kinase
VLIEDDGDAVVVSVRDDGVGFDRDRLESARAAGRLGVASSVIGRMSAVGGTATVTSKPGAGTEVELRVPR